MFPPCPYDNFKLRTMRTIADQRYRLGAHSSQAQPTQHPGRTAADDQRTEQTVFLSGYMAVLLDNPQYLVYCIVTPSSTEENLHAKSAPKV